MARWVRVHTERERLPSVLAAFEEEGVLPRVLEGAAGGRVVEAVVEEARLDRVLARLRLALGEGDLAVVGEAEWVYPALEPASERTPLEELEPRLVRAARVGPVFLLLTALSALVAFFGLFRDDPVLLVASMITAPLMAPLVALALAGLERHRRLFRQAAWAILAGFALAFAVGAGLAAFIPGEPSAAMRLRSAPNLADLALALSAGTMAALAYVASLAEALVGVMVAIALLPPAVNAGMLLVWNQAPAALGSALLLLVNAAAILFASSVAFAVAFRWSFRKVFLPALLWLLIAGGLFLARRL